MSKTAKFIRVITTPPFAAFFLFTVIYFAAPRLLSGFKSYIFAVIFYTAFPLLSYVFTSTVPSLKKGGRKTERKTAVIFSVVGYIAAFAFYFISGGTAAEKIICLTYLISGIIIALLSALHFKASGHTCGVSGPVTALSLLVSFKWIFAYIILLPVFWASLKTKRHTLPQLIVGAVISAAVAVILRLFIK